jgi:hypothetical protein
VREELSEGASWTGHASGRGGDGWGISGKAQGGKRHVSGPGGGTVRGPRGGGNPGLGIDALELQIDGGRGSTRRASE